jgi:hypothetical protein
LRIRISKSREKTAGGEMARADVQRSEEEKDVQRTRDMCMENHCGKESMRPGVGVGDLEMHIKSFF